MARLRIVGIGDGGGADFEVALGLRELLGIGGFLRDCEGQIVFREQNVEVGL